MFAQLESQLRQKDQKQGNILDQTVGKLDELQREITYREGEIGALRRKIKEREMGQDAAMVSDSLNRQKVKELTVTGGDKDQQIAELKAKLFETQRQLDQVVLSRKSEGTAGGESEVEREDHLRARRSQSGSGKNEEKYSRE